VTHRETQVWRRKIRWALLARISSASVDTSNDYAKYVEAQPRTDLLVLALAELVKQTSHFSILRCGVSLHELGEATARRLNGVSCTDALDVLRTRLVVFESVHHRPFKIFETTFKGISAKISVCSPNRVLDPSSRGIRCRRTTNCRPGPTRLGRSVSSAASKQSASPRR
jgi:hypothetical protein